MIQDLAAGISFWNTLKASSSGIQWAAPSSDIPLSGLSDGQIVRHQMIVDTLLTKSLLIDVWQQMLDVFVAKLNEDLINRFTAAGLGLNQMVWASFELHDRTATTSMQQVLLIEGTIWVVGVHKAF